MNNDAYTPTFSQADNSANLETDLIVVSYTKPLKIKIRTGPDLTDIHSNGATFRIDAEAWDHVPPAVKTFFEVLE